MKILNICDPSLYPKRDMDVPTMYQKLARDPRIELFHVPAESVRHPDRVEVIPVTADLDYEGFRALEGQTGEIYPLSYFDVVFCRRLKPFPPGYLELLAQWEKHIPFVNRPSGKMRQVQQSFFPMIADGWMSEHLITRDPIALKAFLQQHSVVVAKRANSCGGRGIFKLWRQGRYYYLDHHDLKTQKFKYLESCLAFLLQGQVEPILFVEYLQNVTAGDKRVVVVDGEIYGAYLRKSRQGHWINNVSADGVCELTGITPHEVKAIQATMPFYQKLGLHTLGYDFLMGNDGQWTLSEINAGNIGGFARLESLTGDLICDRFIGWLMEFSNRMRPRYGNLHVCAC